MTELDEIRGPLVSFGPEDGLLLLGESLFLAADEITESRNDGIPSGLHSGSVSEFRCDGRILTILGIGVVPLEVDAWGGGVAPSGPLIETLGISSFEASSRLPVLRAPGGMYALAPRTTPAYL